jgi:hypothetical protein
MAIVYQAAPYRLRRQWHSCLPALSPKPSLSFWPRAARKAARLHGKSVEPRVDQGGRARRGGMRLDSVTGSQHSLLLSHSQGMPSCPVYLFRGRALLWTLNGVGKVCSA